MLASKVSGTSRTVRPQEITARVSHAGAMPSPQTNRVVFGRASGSCSTLFVDAIYVMTVVRAAWMEQ
eukprot:1183260-Prorocentrum_minimum.AAC.4